jgi:asparagine synthase (glutamine-hydrolysing)
LAAQAGVAHLRGGTPEPGVLDALLGALTPLPGESEHRLRLGAAEIGCLAREGAGPARQGPLAAVLDGHLAEGDAAAAALRAYASSREDFPAALRGQFALSVWDEDRRRLALARDPAGCRPLFYARAGDLLLWASSVGALLAARPDLAEVDERTLATYLAGVEPADPDRTAWARVKRVPAEHVLSSAGGAPRVTRYSNLLAPPRDADPGPAPARLRGLLREAATRAARSRSAAVAMSGGMDSTSVAASIDPGAAGSVRLLSMGYERSPELDESDLIDLVVERVRLPHEYVPIDDTWPLSDYPRSYSAHPDLPPLFGGLAWGRIAERAAEHGAEVLLTGHGGDGGLAYSQIHHVELFRGSLRRALSELRAYRAMRGEWPRELRTAAALALRRHAPRLFELPRFSPLTGERSVLTAAAVERTGVEADLRAQTRMLGRSAGRERSLRLSFGWHQQRINELLADIAHARGLEVRHPFLDSELFAYTTSLPERAVCSHGVRKRALREGMRGVLPDEVRRSIRAAPILNLFRLGYGPEGRGPEIRELLRDPLLGRMGLIRRERVVEALDRFLAGDKYSLAPLNASVVAEIWLRHRLGEPLPGA